ncbi:MAG: NUDIX hydrolase [Verrucomicrobiota bacterium]
MKQTHEEWFEIVDEHDCVVGRARRSECHGNPNLVHRTAHVVVFSTDGRLLLQKRSARRDIQPGKWDTAVGGHLQPGENYEQAARRETQEELGIDLGNEPLEYLFQHRIRNRVESENVAVYKLVHDGPFEALSSEIDALRFWSLEELAQQRHSNSFTPNLQMELDKLMSLIQV